MQFHTVVGEHKRLCHENLSHWKLHGSKLMDSHVCTTQQEIFWMNDRINVKMDTGVIGDIYLYLKITNECPHLFFSKCGSDIVLMCGSDRSIQVFDMNKGAVAAVLPDAHSRAIHCISQNKVRSTLLL